MHTRRVVKIYLQFVFLPFARIGSAINWHWPNTLRMVIFRLTIRALQLYTQQELSYRKHIARKLRTEYAEGTYIPN